MTDSDSRLIERAKTDPEAFGELYVRYVDRIYNYIYHRVGDLSRAEDLTARTFHKALTGLPGYIDRGAPFSAWLYRIAHNVVANSHRDRSRRETLAIDTLEIEVEDGSEVWADRTLTREMVRLAVRRLDDDRQALLVLKFGQGLTNAEIAAVLGRSEGAIKSLYHRTLAALREQLVDAPRNGSRTGGSSDGHGESTG